MTPTGTTDASVSRAHEKGQVELVLSQIDSLPTLPAVAVELLERTADANTGTRDIVELISSDQSLASKVLSLINRADRGVEIATIDRAVVLLGIDSIRSLVLSIQVFEVFSRDMAQNAGRLDRNGFWRHSLAVGCAARLIAEALAGAEGKKDRHLPKPEEAFLCGLLHDVGKVVFDTQFVKSYERVLSRVEAIRGCIADIERDVFGLDHTSVGQRLAEHWKLPAMIRECIWLHHQQPTSTPVNIDYPEHVRCVQAANRLVRQMRIGYSGNYTVESALKADEIGLASETFDQIVSSLPELIESRAELIGLNRLTSTDVYYEALAKTNAEVARVNTSLTIANRRLEQRSRCFEALRQLNEAMSDEPMHEDVCRSSSMALSTVLCDRSSSVVGFSDRRGVVVLASHADAAQSSRTDMLASSTIDGLAELRETPAGWVKASVLPRALLDRMCSLLSAPPTWCWVIRHQGKCSGVIVLSGDRPADADESIAALSGAIGLWLGNAEARVMARDLNEELSDMNRRLVSSQTELARTRSLAMVGEMAAGAAHEMNNPLAVISGRAQMLSQHHEDEEVSRAAGLIAENAHRASAIVTELMDFAKPAPPQVSDFTLAELLGEIRRDWVGKTSLNEEQFCIELSDDQLEIRADAAQIRGLFDEVIRNAIEAMRDQSNPLLVVNCRGDLADGRVVIGIQDNGTGMSPDVLERAVDPFFSSRPAGRSRGLGLSRAVRYAEINGGHLRVSSTLGEGTIVLIELPVASD